MNQEDPISINRIAQDELHRISELDRSEHVTLAYEIKDGTLAKAEVDWHVPTWFVEVDGEHSLTEQIVFCRSHLDQGGVMLGAFKDDLLVGAAIVQPRLREDMAQLAFLHVSQGFRRQGIAEKLMGEACTIARDAGARRMYISSIPSSSAVGFYLAQGCKLAVEVDPELYALEPEDIHLVLEL
jgi:predicted N-acetyltransferase YhbS